MPGRSVTRSEFDAGHQEFSLLRQYSADASLQDAELTGEMLPVANGAADTLLRRSSTAHSANMSIRAAAFLRTQQTHGNRLVQRVAANAAPLTSTPVPQRTCACGGVCDECRQAGRNLARHDSPDAPEFAHRERMGDSDMLTVADAFRDQDRDFSSDARAIARQGGLQDPPDGIRVRWGSESRRAAAALDAVAFSYGPNVFVDTDRFRPGTPAGDWVIRHELQHTIEQSGARPELALLSEAQFRKRLGARPEQEAVIDALFSNARFRALWDYLGSCPATPAQDHGPVRLLVTPGLRSGGVERFGGYNLATRTLEINPTKAEHVRNPQELVDTVVHEVIHAMSDLEGACVAAGALPSSLGGAGSTTPVLGGLPPLGPTELGPGASNPCDESIDIDVAAQRIVTDVIRENMRTTRIGAPTLTFLNEVIRSDPAALAAYDACRRPACALSNPAVRAAAISRCSMDVLGAFMTADLLPSRVLFDFDSHVIRPDAQMALDLVATFMRVNATTHVILEGHADPRGSDTYNDLLAQRRAEAVGTFLIGRGVSPAQIDDVTSVGKRRPLSTVPKEFFQDRRVELIFLSAP